MEAALLQVRSAGYVSTRLPESRGGRTVKSLVLFLFSLCILGLLDPGMGESPSAWAQEPPLEWNVGIATTPITPQQPMWLAGYAARDKPSEGKIHDLYAKALVLQDAAGAKLVIVTLDLLGINRQIRDWVEKEAQKHHGIDPAHLLINCSHTHSGPVMEKTDPSIYGDSFYRMPPEQKDLSRAYSRNLRETLVKLIGEASVRLVPARLAYTHARAGFAMNRRFSTDKGVLNHPNPDGPVDHNVPVLRIDGPDGKLLAVVFGYACHSTTLSFYQFCGDYPGFAQQYLEEAHPGMTAYFVAGCGGDQNPYPRRTLDLACQHGRALANGVEAALQTRATRPVRGPIRSALEDTTLEFTEPPTREQLEQMAKSTNKYEKLHAEILLGELERNGKIRTTYPYPVQVIRFGNDLMIIALAGEVVVDYSLRLKAELINTPLWVAGYSNDVFGYVPSQRVLREGGYEGRDAMLYTEFPGPFTDSVEDLIMGKVRELVGRVSGKE